ncbi:MAG: ATP-binding cassette domain-containing protein, partial [Alphaproteobacteria bacterium]
PRPLGKLAVSKLAFIPEGLEEPVFSGLSFQVNPGELLGITGPVGAGKSTLVRLLLGVIKPAQGSVRLDGADVYAWNADDLGRHVGYIPQVVELLPGTIRDNIARFSAAPSEQVIEAAHRAGIHQLILQFPEGYDTVIGGPADRLSVGTRQRVALARALFGDPSLVILDEPYSNLDMDGVTALIEAIQGLKARGATTIIVAHRPSILAHAERVLLLQDGCGKIVTKGTHTNLRVFSGADQPAGKAGADDAARSVA